MSATAALVLGNTEGWSELHIYIHTVYNCTSSDFPAKNIIANAPYIYIYMYLTNIGKPASACTRIQNSLCAQESMPANECSESMPANECSGVRCAHLLQSPHPFLV